MKKSLLIVSAFFLITSVSTENAFGMKRWLGNLWKKEQSTEPAAKRTNAEDTTAQDLQQHIEQAAGAEPTQTPATAPAAPVSVTIPVIATTAEETVPMEVEGQESKESATATTTTEQPQDPVSAADMAAPVAGATAQAGAIILRSVASTEPFALNAVRPTNDTGFIIVLLQNQTSTLWQQLCEMSEQLSQMARAGNAGQREFLQRFSNLQAGQERQERSHTQFQAMLQNQGEEIQAMAKTQAADGEQLTRANAQLTKLDGATQENHILIVAVQGNVAAINEQIATLNQHGTEMGQQITQIDERVRAGFARSATDSQGIRRSIEQLNRRTNGAPILLLLSVATATGIPLYVFRGIIIAGIGTSVMVLATNQAYPLYIQISQNPVVKFICNLFSSIGAEQEQGAPAPVVQVPAVQAQAAAAHAAAPQAIENGQAPVAQAVQAQNLGLIGRFFRKK